MEELQKRVLLEDLAWAGVRTVWREFLRSGRILEGFSRLLLDPWESRRVT